MSRYEVGIFIEGIVEAETEIDAIHTFMKSVSYKDCYVKELEDEQE